jgi:predicted lipoprotein with Yx(FWY)xxD motif
MPLTRLRRRNKVILGAAALAAATAGAGAYVYVNYASVDRYTSGHGQVTVKANPVDGNGPVLVTDKGYALYMFPPDGASRVSCTGDCAFAWPPLLVPGGGTVVAGEGVPLACSEPCRTRTAAVAW